MPPLLVTVAVYAHVIPGQDRDAADRLGAVLGTGTRILKGALTLDS